MGLLGFDSLDALRLSLTERLRGNNTGGSADDLSPVIGALLLSEARDNERRIASVRAGLAAFYLLAVAARRLSGDVVHTDLAFSAIAWAGFSLVVFQALRSGWYRDWVRRFLPVADASAIGVASYSLTRDVLLPETRAAVIASAALLCALLIFTGAMRLTRLSTIFAWFLSTIAFIFIGSLVQLSALAGSAVLCGLLASSVLAWRITDVIRRVITTEVGRLRMEREMDRANARAVAAQAASSAREEVLRVVAHDLRNPLGTLLMSADLIADVSLGEDARAKQFGVVKRTGARMNRLIQDLLDIARIESGKFGIDAKVVSPAVLLANASELMRPLAEERSLQLDISAHDSLPDVHADAERIGQVFSNLVGNAIKFTPAGGRIVIDATENGRDVTFTVTDTGAGMSAEQLEKVFGPFWQANQTDRRGIGLGLSIAKGIVEAHKGTIGVSSNPGAGTTFWFTLGSMKLGLPSDGQERQELNH